MYIFKFVSLLALVITLFWACKSETPKTANDIQEIKENYGTGETSRIYTRIDGKIEGKMTDYYPSGALKGERYFIDDQQHGKTTLYFESGEIKEVQYYDKGLREGGDTLFYEDGKIKFVTEFKNNVKNGYLRKWDEDGGLIYEAKFAMDTLIEVAGKPVKQEIIAK